MRINCQVEVKYIPDEKLNDFIKKRLIDLNLSFADYCKQNDFNYNTLYKYLNDCHHAYSIPKFNELFAPMGVYINEKTRSISIIKK